MEQVNCCVQVPFYTQKHGDEFFSEVDACGKCWMFVRLRTVFSVEIEKRINRYYMYCKRFNHSTSGKTKEEALHVMTGMITNSHPPSNFVSNIDAVDIHNIEITDDNWEVSPNHCNKIKNAHLLQF